MRWARAAVFAIALLLASCCAPEPVETAWIVEGCVSSSHWDYNGGQIAAEVLRSIVEADSDYRTVLFNHDSDRPVGRILSLSYADGKLHTRVKISKTAPKVWRLIQEGVLTGISIGIHVWEMDFDYLEGEDKEVKVARVADLIELSIVSLPANPDARISRWYVIKKTELAGARLWWESSAWFSSWLARLTRSTPVLQSTPPASTP